MKSATRDTLTPSMFEDIPPGPAPFAPPDPRRAADIAAARVASAGVAPRTPVLDAPASRAATEAGVALCDSGLSENWKAVAVRAVAALASAKEELTTDDLWEMIALAHPDLMAGVNPSGLGPVMRRAASEGHIALTDRTTPSLRPSAHRRPMRVWRSLVRVPVDSEGQVAA